MDHAAVFAAGQGRTRRTATRSTPWRYEDGRIGGPAEEVERSQVIALIEQGLENLPARQREAFLLRYWEELDVSETAQAMGCSEGSVKTHCSRATHSLAAFLEVERDYLMNERGFRAQRRPASGRRARRTCRRRCCTGCGRREMRRWREHSEQRASPAARRPQRARFRVQPPPAGAHGRCCSWPLPSCCSGSRMAAAGATRHADFADVDTEVLTGELPVVAYLDPGFEIWLYHHSPASAED